VLYVADIIDSPWSSLVERSAVEALHAMVSHDSYCQKLLESGTVDSETFQGVLPCLADRRWQLTFGACWARLATQHWELAVGKARKSTVFGKESAPGGGVEPGSRLVSPDILVTICRHIQAAVLVGFLFMHHMSPLPIAFLSVRCAAYF